LSRALDRRRRGADRAGQAGKWGLADGELGPDPLLSQYLIRQPAKPPPGETAGSLTRPQTSIRLIAETRGLSTAHRSRGDERHRGGGDRRDRPRSWWWARHPGLVPRGDRVLKGVPGGVPVSVLAGDGKPALAQRARGTVTGVNIDDQRGLVPRVRFTWIHVQHNPAGRQAVESFNGYHDVRFSKALWLTSWSAGIVHSP
jgi:hypothetical protein